MAPCISSSAWSRWQSPSGCGVLATGSHEPDSDHSPSARHAYGLLPRRRALAAGGSIVDVCEGQARTVTSAASLVPNAGGRTVGQTLALGRHLPGRKADRAFTAHRSDRVE